MKRKLIPRWPTAALPALALVAGLLFVGTSTAQEGIRRELAADSFVPTSVKAGARIRVTGKYKELLDKELSLFDCNASFRLQRQDLIKKLLDFQAKRDNLSIDAVALLQEGTLILDAEDISAAPSDMEVFTREAAALSGKATRGWDDSLDLTKRILSTCERFGDRALLPVAKRVFSESLVAETAALDEKAVEERLGLIRDLHRIAKDASFVMDVALSLKERAPGNSSIAGFLTDIKCRHYGGKWVTIEELKRLEGLVERRGMWITPREKHLADSMDELRREKLENLVLRKRTDREYKLLAERGVLEEGMKPEEAQIVLGFPDRVERRSLAGKEFVQWTYGSKHCYFHDSILIRKPAAEK